MKRGKKRMRTVSAGIINVDVKQRGACSPKEGRHDNYGPLAQEVETHPVLDTPGRCCRGDFSR